MPLLPTDIYKIKKIFKEKNWGCKYDTLFNNICRAVEILEDDEKELFFFLTKKFLKINDTDYFPKIRKVIENIIFPEDIQRIIIVPLLKECDFSKTKSSSVFLYTLKEQLREIHKINKPIYDFSNYKIINQLIDDQTLLIVPDDFIGSGSYAHEFLEELRDKHKDIKNIIFITIAILKSGENLLKQLNYNVYSYYHLKKGIEDDNSISNSKKNEYYTILHKLSERIGVKNEYEKGFYNSEALISLIKIPNNTFGLYWCVSKKGKELEWPQLFQRY